MAIVKRPSKPKSQNVKPRDKEDQSLYRRARMTALESGRTGRDFLRRETFAASGPSARGFTSIADMELTYYENATGFTGPNLPERPPQGRSERNAVRGSENNLSDAIRSDAAVT